MKNTTFLILILFIISGCGSIKDLDKPVCTRVTMERGFCTNLLSAKDQFVDDEHLLNGKTWFELLPTMIYVPVETWAAIKKYIITECKRTNRCDGMVESWDRTINVLDAQINSKGE